MLSIVVLQTFRCIFGELLLSRDLDIRVRKDIVLEVLMTATFIATAWFLRLLAVHHSVWGGVSGVCADQTPGYRPHAGPGENP